MQAATARAEALAEIAYENFTRHQADCESCQLSPHDTDGMCTPGRFYFHEWMRAERRASRSGIADLIQPA